MIWKYKTILFESPGNKALRTEDIDDGELENALNELGGQGWDLVNLTSLQNGLLFVMKRPDAPAAAFANMKNQNERNLRPASSEQTREYHELEDELDETMKNAVLIARRALGEAPALQKEHEPVREEPLMPGPKNAEDAVGPLFVPGVSERAENSARSSRSFMDEASGDGPLSGEHARAWLKRNEEGPGKKQPGPHPDTANPDDDFAGGIRIS